MKPLSCTVIALALAAPFACAAQARPSSDVHSHAAPAAAQSDPFVPVYIVTSRELYSRGIASIAGNGVSRRDSLGHELVLIPAKAHQLADITRFVHEKEKRCGGYFAFATQAEADAFIRTDAAAQSVSGTFLASYPIDNRSTVDPWLPQVTERNIYNTISHLSGYQNRYYTSSTGKTSAEWIRTTWQGLAGSRSDVTTELFTACSDCATQPSVILTVRGSELPNEIVVLGAHLDSINSSAGGSTSQRAPGADDDASGVASLTEIIRISLASGWKPKRTVKFMGYAAEEVGLRGSKAIAQSFKSQGRNVVGVLQLDMTNYNASAPEEMQLVTDYSNADLKTFVTQLFDTYLAPLGHTRGTYTCGYGCSDHASWTSAGYPSAMMFEGGDASGRPFGQIHTSGDTLLNMGDSARHSVKFAKLGLAFLGELSKTAGTGGSTRQTYTNGTDVTIRDNATVESPISVSGRSGYASSATPVAVNIVHTYIGDLKVDLIAPDGSVYVLHNRSGGSADNINTTYTVNLSTELLNGTWKLRVNDNYAGDTGYINSWSVTF